MNGTQEFKIEVINRQSGMDFKDTVEERSVCTYRESRGVYYISYKTEDSHVLIKAENDMVIVRRTGGYGSEMIYETGKETEFEYRTPYGSIPMRMSTEYVSFMLGEDGGVIELRYILYAGGDKLINEMKIKIER